MLSDNVLEIYLDQPSETIECPVIEVAGIVSNISHQEVCLMATQGTIFFGFAGDNDSEKETLHSLIEMFACQSHPRPMCVAKGYFYNGRWWLTGLEIGK